MDNIISLTKAIWEFATTPLGTIIIIGPIIASAILALIKLIKNS